MSAFNTVVLPSDEHCPRCGNLIKRRVQFKYGDTWQYEFMVGDRIGWGGHDIGIRATLVKVLGYPEECPSCRYDLGGVFDVMIRDDVIDEVIPGSAQPYIDAGNASYIVLEA